jgi:hypothetical protein
MYGENLRTVFERDRSRDQLGRGMSKTFGGDGISLYVDGSLHYRCMPMSNSMTRTLKRFVLFVLCKTVSKYRTTINYMHVTYLEVQYTDVCTFKCTNNKINKNK